MGTTLYPESSQVPAMKFWSLPSGREHELNTLCENGDYFAEEKKDGAYYMLERTSNHIYLFGRNTSVTTGELSEKGDRVPHIIEALSVLPADTIVIGEIYYPGGTSKTTTTIMGALAEEAIKRQETRGKIHYYLFDIIKYDGVNLQGAGALDRYKILKAVYEKYNLNKYDYIELAEAFEQDIQKRLAEILASGGEGIVLKKKDFSYQPGKRPAYSSCKVKQMDTIDLVCVGFCEPTKEYTGKELATWPYWVYFDLNDKPVVGSDHTIDANMCEDLPSGEWKPVTKPYYLGWKTAMRVGAYNDKGELVEIGTVSSGLTDEDRETMAKEPEKYLGKVFHFRCMSLDKINHTLRHPVFVGEHPDKDAKDCIISDIFS